MWRDWLRIARYLAPSVLSGCPLGRKGDPPDEQRDPTDKPEPAEYRE
ncbi:MAG: hypothetical protein OXF23_05340 [Candidatus Dadabacteria bacterium]|nr:hypothetical protein [Candidatus Dadabacteria bacterium]